MDGQTMGQWIAIGIMVAFMAIEKALKIVNKKNNKPSNNPYPCQRHGEDISEMKADIRNLRDDVNRIENKLNGMK